MIAKDKKFLFFVVYSIILVFTVCISYTFISSYIKEKQEFEQFKQTWQYRADTNFTQSIEIDEETGEQTVVYEIFTPEQLAGMSIHSKNVKADSNQKVKYLLKQSLDLSGYNWSSVNTSSSDFDGDGFVISGLTSAYVDNLTGTIENLILTDVQISKSGNAGAVANSSSGTIKNVQVVSSSKDSYVKGKTNVGGIVGEMTAGSIINCSNKASVSGGYSIGGIVGNMSGGSITNCRNYGSISPSSSTNVYVGGIIGECSSGSGVSKCYNVGSISGSGTSNTYVGGVVGKANKTISLCINAGSISGGGKYNTGDVYVGGIAGYSSSSISNCYNKGSITADSKADTSLDKLGCKGTLTSSNKSYYQLSTKKIGNTALYLNTYIWQGFWKDWYLYPEEHSFDGGKTYLKDFGTVNSYSSVVSKSIHDEYAGGISGYGNGSISYCYNSGTITSGASTFQIAKLASVQVNTFDWTDEYLICYYCQVSNIYLNNSGINGKRDTTSTKCYSYYDEECADEYVLSSEIYLQSQTGSSSTYDSSTSTSVYKKVNIGRDSNKLSYVLNSNIFASFVSRKLKIKSNTQCDLKYSGTTNIGTKSASTGQIDTINYELPFYDRNYENEPSNLVYCLNGYSSDGAWGDDSSKGGLYLTDLYW